MRWPPSSGPRCSSTTRTRLRDRCREFAGELRRRQRRVRGQGVPVHGDGPARGRGGTQARRRHRRGAARRAARRVPGRTPRASTGTTRATRRSRPRATRASASSSRTRSPSSTGSSGSGSGGRVFVRVTPGVEAHTHEFIETGTERLEVRVLRRQRRRARCRAPGRRRTRADASAGSTATSARRCSASTRAPRPPRSSCAFAEECERETGAPVPVLNLGGGLGTRYLDRRPDRWTSVSTRGSCTTRSGDRTVMVEPGRVDRRLGRASPSTGSARSRRSVTCATYVAVDGGMSDNPRPVLYGAGYEAYLPDRIGEPRPARRVDRGEALRAG